MDDNESTEYTPQERAARALWLLMQEPMPTAEVARRLGLTPKWTRQMLRALCRVVPLYSCMVDGHHVWYIAGKTDKTR